MFNPSRDNVRTFFIHTWQKYQTHVVLSDLEKIALDIILKHPEYHHILKLDSLQRNYFPEDGVINPFLHMSLHLTIAEQVSIDQPHPIRALHLALCQKIQDVHEAEHLMMDGLIEMRWQANKNHSIPDMSIYLSSLAKLLGKNMDAFIHNQDKNE